MQLTKYKITAQKCTGYMMVVYQDNRLKSILNEFNPPLSAEQVYFLLNNITVEPGLLKPQFEQAAKNKIKVEQVTASPVDIAEQQPPDDMPANGKIAMWCKGYENWHLRTNKEIVKYKTSAADSGKMKALTASAQEFEVLVNTYFNSDVWYLTPKSIANFIKKYNEIRALVVAKPAVKTYPLPYDQDYFARLNMMQQREYHQYLIANGYKFQHNPGRSGKWVKSPLTP